MKIFGNLEIGKFEKLLNGEKNISKKGNLLKKSLHSMERNCGSEKKPNQVPAALVVA